MPVVQNVSARIISFGGARGVTFLPGRPVDLTDKQVEMLKKDRTLQHYLQAGDLVDPSGALKSDQQQNQPERGKDKPDPDAVALSLVGQPLNEEQQKALMESAQASSDPDRTPTIPMRQRSQLSRRSGEEQPLHLAGMSEEDAVAAVHKSNSIDQLRAAYGSEQRPKVREAIDQRGEQLSKSKGK